MEPRGALGCGETPELGGGSQSALSDGGEDLDRHAPLDEAELTAKAATSAV